MADARTTWKGAALRRELLGLKRTELARRIAARRGERLSTWTSRLQNFEQGCAARDEVARAVEAELYAELGIVVRIERTERGAEPGSRRGGGRAPTTLAGALRLFLDRWVMSGASRNELARAIATVDGTYEGWRQAFRKLERGDEPGPTLRRIAAALDTLALPGWEAGRFAAELSRESDGGYPQSDEVKIRSRNGGGGRAGLSQKTKPAPTEHARCKPGLLKVSPAVGAAGEMERFERKETAHAE